MVLWGPARGESSESNAVEWDSAPEVWVEGCSTRSDFPVDGLTHIICGLSTAAGLVLASREAMASSCGFGSPWDGINIAN